MWLAQGGGVTLGDVRDVLEKNGVMPSRQLGQNFLVDANMARWIVDRLELDPADAVVEVGPGTGALTEHVVGRARRVILVEFDSRLAEALRLRYADRTDVEVHHQDAVNFDVRQLFKHRPLKFLGNLPYSCGGAILRNFLTVPHPFERAVIMLQKEVIDRIQAEARSDDFGLLSLRMQCSWEIQAVKLVPPTVFYPQPQVDSSVAVLTPRQGMPPFDRRLFDELIRRGFAQRRKQLRKQLPATRNWEDVVQLVGEPLTVRAEELSLEQWVKLTQFYDEHPLKNCPQDADELLDRVDEHDQVIGQATRGEMHAQDWRHRAVHIFVFNQKRDLLLQLRSRAKDRHPGVWDSSAAGHLDAGEDYASSARRELEEELGITGAPMVEVTALKPCANNGWEHIRLFAARYDGSLRFPCAEIEAVQWFAQDEITQWLKQRPSDFAPGFIQCWEAFQQTQADPK